MRVFVAGATGVMGRQLLPLLVQAGHKVTGMTRSEDRAASIRQVGAAPVVCDVFEREEIVDAVRAARPDVVIHQLTSIPKRLDLRKAAEQLAPTNRLRSEGTSILIEAAGRAGARRFIAQSIAFAYDPAGDSLATEEDPLHRIVPPQFADILGAVQTLERTVLGANALEGVVLRYGYFYGPGTIYARDGSFAQDVSRRRMPLVGHGGGVFSFIHINDAARATVAALGESDAGVYNIVDDDPAPVREWLPYYAEQLGARRPFRVPRWLGRLAAGSYAVYLMTEQRGASDWKAKERLGWAPEYGSWREGFRAELEGS